MSAEPTSSGSPMTLRAPGWYPDPDAAADGAQRFWTGARWSDLTRGSSESAPVSTARVLVPEALEKARKEATWMPLGLAAFSVIGIVLIPLMHVIGVAFITLALVAVVTGVKALGLRSKGHPIPVLPPIAGIGLGIASGGLLTLVLIGHFVARLL